MKTAEEILCSAQEKGEVRVVTTLQMNRFGHTRAIVNATNGKKSILKILSIDDYIAMLKKTTAKEEGSICTGLLPMGTLSYLQKEKSFSLLYYVKGLKGVLTLRGKHIEIPFPNALLWMNSNGNVRLWAIKENDLSLVTEDTFLYVWPFDNVYSGARVCTGSVNMRMSSPMDAPIAASMLLTADNTHTNNTKKKYTSTEVVSYITSNPCEAFPEQFLEPYMQSNRHYTVKDLINEMKRS